MVEKLLIVYVRGFAGDTSGINKTVADPFCGFNEGLTDVRVGGDGEPIFYQFESPLLRLYLDEDYQILVQGGQLAYLDSHDKVPADSIWIHRFYDVSATTWAERPQDYSLRTRRRGPARAHRDAPSQDRSATSAPARPLHGRADLAGLAGVLGGRQVVVAVLLDNRPAKASGQRLAVLALPTDPQAASRDMRTYRPPWITRPPSHPASSS
jgi:hypothetical protein